MESENNNNNKSNSEKKRSGLWSRGGGIGGRWSKDTKFQLYDEQVLRTVMCNMMTTANTAACYIEKLL